MQRRIQTGANASRNVEGVMGDGNIIRKFEGRS